MKKFILILFLANSVTFSQNTKKGEVNEESKAVKFDNVTKEEVAELEKQIAVEKKLVSYILDFLKKEYVEKSEKKIPKLEKELSLLERKFAVAQSKASKKKIQEKIKAKKQEIEVEKMWKIYYQAYVIRDQSYGKDDKKYFAAYKILMKIKKRYKELTAKEFVDPESVFKEKYAAQIKKLKDESAKK